MFLLFIRKYFQFIVKYSLHINKFYFCIIYDIFSSYLLYPHKRSLLGILDLVLSSPFVTHERRHVRPIVPWNKILIYSTITQKLIKLEFWNLHNVLNMYGGRTLLFLSQIGQQLRGPVIQLLGFLINISKTTYARITKFYTTTFCYK